MAVGVGIDATCSVTNLVYLIRFARTFTSFTFRDNMLFLVISLCTDSGRRQSYFIVHFRIRGSENWSFSFLCPVNFVNVWYTIHIYMIELCHFCCNFSVRARKK